LVLQVQSLKHWERPKSTYNVSTSRRSVVHPSECTFGRGAASLMASSTLLLPAPHDADSCQEAEIAHLFLSSRGELRYLGRG